MGSGIFYNQSVTIDDLNNIAIDLGATSFNGFGENKFGAAELNNITKDLVGKGYLLKGNKCKVAASGDNLVILDGIVVFENGAKKEIAENLTVVCVKGKVYYFLNDTASGTCRLCAEDDYPSSGDFVPLCEVQSDGTIVDKRVLSVAKVDLNSIEKNKTETVQSESFDISKDVSGTVVATIPLEFSGYNLIRINSIGGAGENYNIVSHRELPDSGQSERVLVSYARAVTFERSAEGINIYGYSYQNPDSGASYSVNITLF